MTVREILLGKDCSDAKNVNCHFPGLIPLCKIYLQFVGVDSVSEDKINGYAIFALLFSVIDELYR